MNKNYKSSKISALVVCLSDESISKEYLENLSFANEIIILNYSALTKKIGIANGSKIDYLENEFSNFSTLLTSAVSSAKNDWLFLFDSDEIISPDLKDELIITSATEKNKAYFVKHNFIFFDKEIKHGGFQNRKTIRFFNKKYCHITSDNINFAIQTTEKTGVLKQRLDDSSYKSFDLYNEKLNAYSQIKANYLYNSNIKPKFYHFFIKPLHKFIIHYFIKLGFLDGKEGYILAYLHSFAVLKCYLTLWLKYKKMK
ncbi:MAG: hypothetical protein JHC39_06735 [Lentimicrobium sp.]|jgi:hypothetical protein|nr:hypothetical protein [Lentimicrobium sp.]